jgi:hypothetical protein
MEQSIMDSLNMGVDSSSCGCAPKIICPNCFLVKEIKNIHETSFREAEHDAETEDKLSQQSELSVGSGLFRRGCSKRLRDWPTRLNNTSNSPKNSPLTCREKPTRPTRPVVKCNT